MRKTFRKLLADENTYVAPGVFDCIGAKAAEKTGLEFVFVTGNGLSASVLGLPDVGLMTMREVVDCSANIAACVNIPVIGDADTGYGSILNVLRTTREFERAGLAGIFLEDQMTPKRCAYYPGEQRLVPATEHAKKIKAAVQARSDSDFCIIARTDALRIYGVEETISRACCYIEAGADAIFTIGLQDINTVHQIASAITVPLIINVNDGDPLTRVSVDALNTAGAKIIFYPATIRAAVAKAALTAMSCLKRTGNTAEIAADMISLLEFSSLLNLDAYQALEKMVIPETGITPVGKGGERNV